MARRTKAVRFFDFSGGLNNTAPETTLRLNEATDLQNITLLPSGGFEKRRGNGEFNASAMNGGASVHGLAYYRQSGGGEFMMVICGDKLFSSSSLTGTMADVTGAVSINSGNNNIWTSAVMNDMIIFVGGVPDAPIKFNGTGNAAVLGGSPPNGSFVIQLNNFLFIGNTAANPSRIQWSVLGDPEDWAGAGSGTQDISKNDGDTLVGAVPLGNDRLILFKQNSIHEMTVRNPPFPVFPKIRGTGAVSKRGIVTVNDVIYFITPEGRMKATDGYRIESFPDKIDDIWDNLNQTRLQYIQGFYYPHLDQIWWVCSDGASSTHDLCIVWDVEHKVWLKNPTGFKMNAITLAQDRLAYGGAYNGKVYLLDKVATFTDASESAGTIDAYWRSGWLDLQQMIESKYFPYVDLNFVTQSSGTFTFSYGFDFNTDRVTESISMAGAGAIYGVAIYGVDVYGGQADKSKLLFTKGNGKFVQFKVRNGNNNEAFAFNGFEVPMKALDSRALKAT